MARASAPRPAAASMTTNGSGSPSRRHSASRARATTAPNSGPTSGLVRKSALRPAPAPEVKKPPSPYRKASTATSNRTGPSRWIRSNSARMTLLFTLLWGPNPTTCGRIRDPKRGWLRAERGQVGEAGDDLRQDTDGEGAEGAERDRRAEGGRHPDRRAVLVVHGAHERLSGHRRVVEEPDHRVHAEHHAESDAPPGGVVEQHADDDELGVPTAERRDAGQR